MDWGDKETAQKSLDDLKIKDSVIIACIFDKEGNVFAKYIGDTAADCPMLSGQNISIDWNRLAIYNIVSFHNADIGSIYIESDIRDIVKEVPKYLMFVLFLILAVLCITSYVSFLYQNFRLF